MTKIDTSSDNARFDVAVKGAAARREAERKSPARERKDTMGGMKLKLSVNGSIEGYHLYWENDEDGAIETLLYDGFEFVSQAEVNMEKAIVSDTDLGDRISRYVGAKSDGSPLRAYLLKCPENMWQDRENVRYKEADARDNDIRSRSSSPDTGQYRPKGYATTLATNDKVK